MQLYGVYLEYLEHRDVASRLTMVAILFGVFVNLLQMPHEPACEVQGKP